MFPNIRPKLWFKNHKDILQLKFFIISYVNSLERRKDVAVWFSSIQERIQCWPTQFSYDLTVNSFGKAFVRNCLLMKKMSVVQKSNRGRTKTLTDSTRKRHKKEDSTKYNKTRVSIGDESILGYLKQLSHAARQTSELQPIYN